MGELEQKNIDKMWNDIEDKCLKLKILMAGKTGVGKGSVVNALIGKEICKVAENCEPCTKCNEEVIWSSEDGNIIITDVPGFGEANSPTINGIDYVENIKMLAENAHVLLLVLKCDDKALETEEKFIIEWKNDNNLNKIPVFIVINQIDKVKPCRMWDPEKLNLNNPSTAKELQISSYINYVSKLPAFSEYYYANKIFPTCAGECFGDKTYGIENLKKGITNNIPEILGLILVREQNSKDERAKEIIEYYAVAAGAAAIQPIPIVDSFILAPIQIAMIIHLGKIYGVNITKTVAGGILNSIGLSLIGNYIFINIVSFVPGIKQVVGPAIAYSITHTSGLIVKELFLTGNLNPSKQELEELAKKYKKETKLAKERYDKYRK